jgi:hypothetical protein
MLARLFFQIERFDVIFSQRARPRPARDLLPLVGRRNGNGLTVRGSFLCQEAVSRFGSVAN